MSLFERLIDRGDEQFGGVAVVLSVDEAFRRLIHIDLACDGIERGLTSTSSTMCSVTSGASISRKTLKAMEPKAKT